MGRLDACDESRLALIGLLAAIIVFTAAGMPGGSRVRLSRLGPSEPAEQVSHGAPSSHAAELEHLQALGKASPTAAQWGQVLAAVDHSSWRVARRAFQVLCAHEHRERRAVATRLLARAIEQERLAAERPDDRDRSPFETIARQTLIAEVAEFMTEPGGGQPAAVLRTVVRFAPQGSVRARALRLLAAVEPRHERRRLAAAALCDSSEPTLVAAIEIVGSNGFTEMSDRLVALAASPRPVLRRHAKHVLRSLGQRVESVDYSTAVLDAVNELASRLVEAGLEFHDVLPWAADASNEAQHEAIVEAAEAYLDGVAGASAAPDDGHGVLLLVAAARSRHDRITIRLWEHEIRFADSNEEMLARGLTALARARLISGLIACRQGDRSAALDDLAGLAGLARRSATDVRLQIYVENAAAVSAAIWRGTRNQFTGLRGPDGGDAATRLATTVLGSLDCTDRAGRLEAHRRIDAWCGIESSPQSGDSRSTRMAN